MQCYDRLRSVIALDYLITHSFNELSNTHSPGAIFEGNDQDLETAFRRAVDRVNIDRTLLSHSRLEATVMYIKPQDSFHAAKIGMTVTPQPCNSHLITLNSLSDDRGGRVGHFRTTVAGRGLDGALDRKQPAHTALPGQLGLPVDAAASALSVEHDRQLAPGADRVQSGVHGLGRVAKVEIIYTHLRAQRRQVKDIAFWRKKVPYIVRATLRNQFNCRLDQAEGPFESARS